MKKIHIFLVYAACLLSVVAVVFSLCNENVCTIESGSIGLMAICATFIVCYQIINSLEMKDAIQKVSVWERQKDEIIHGKHLMQEEIDLLKAQVEYIGNINITSTADAVIYMHHTILSSLRAQRTDYTHIFAYFQMIIDNLTLDSLTGSRMRVVTNNGMFINDIRSPFNKSKVDVAIEAFKKDIENDRKEIEKMENYPLIKTEYVELMECLERKINSELKGNQI